MSEFGPPPRLGVVVVDDQSLVRAGFCSILQREEDLEVVGEAADGVQALEVVERTRPDVVLMDVRMPRMDGIAATRLLSVRHPGTRVLILTTYDLDEYLLDAIRAGASGFLLKDIRAEQLPGAVRAVVQGEVLLSAGPTRRLAETFIPQTSGPSPRIAALPVREREVLEHVARGLSNAEIAVSLHLGATTVKTYVSRLLTRFDLRDRVGLVITAYEEGLVRADGPAAPPSSGRIGTTPL
jgi:DNA-binding NarL/FixJ family response regulator